MEVLIAKGLRKIKRVEHRGKNDDRRMSLNTYSMELSVPKASRKKKGKSSDSRGTRKVTR